MKSTLAVKGRCLGQVMKILLSATFALLLAGCVSAPAEIIQVNGVDSYTFRGETYNKGELIQAIKIRKSTGELQSRIFELHCQLLGSTILDWFDIEYRSGIRIRNPKNNKEVANCESQ